MNVKASILMLALCWPFAAVAQGFAGMGSEAAGFTLPEPDPQFSFPADHGPHNDFRIEWWYLTANLTGPDGTPYGLQWTLFRSALTPDSGAGWQTPQLWMGHAAVTTPDAHFVTERLARGGIGQAGVTAEPFAAWIDDWHMRGSFDAFTMTASGPDFAYEMTLTATGPLVFHGEGGYSVKSAAGQASYYYAQPSYEVTGTLILPEREIEVTGHGWMDREWSSQPLAADQTGWDWFSLTFDDGNKLMGYRLRNADGTSYDVATWIAADGTATPQPEGAFSAEPTQTAEVNGRQVPVHWRVQLPDNGVDVMVEALNDQAWMTTSIPYWEGPVTVSGSHTGTGYLEMTGYE